MIIYINARFLTQSVTGPQRYAIELISSLDQILNHENNFKFILLSPKGIKRVLQLNNIEIREVGRLKGHLWEQIELPYYSRKGILLSLCNTGPIFKRNQLLTIHDALVYRVPNAYSFIYRSWYKILQTILGKTSRRIITDSNCSKQDLINYFKIKNEKIEVIYLGWQHMDKISLDNSIVARWNIKPRDFILAVSSMNPNKNFISICKAINKLQNKDINIVIAGGSNHIFDQCNIPVSENIKLLGYVSDNELKALYENAACFIYPSFFEGFGLPPLEALACNCPIIISNTGSLPEIFGPSAYYVDPNNIEDIAKGISEILEKQEKANILLEYGKELLKKYSWSGAAERLLDIVKEVSNSNFFDVKD